MGAGKSKLRSRIDALSDADLFEAARYYLAATLEAPSADEIEEAIENGVRSGGGDILELETIRTSLMEDITSYREFLRFLLEIAASGSEEDRQRVKETLDGVGQKQVVVETALVLSLGTLASLYLLHLTGGKKQHKRKVKIETSRDGTVRMEVEENVVYASQASALGQFLEWLRQLPGGKPSDS
jgi:hypothetical protein